MTPELQKFLAKVGGGGSLDLEKLADAMLESRYTGPTMIHWRNGVPRQLDIYASPIKLSIVEGLDNHKTPRSGS